MYLLMEPNPSDPSQQLILRISDNAVIPSDPDNGDFQAFLEWLSQGNIPGKVTTSP
jgi:hypothetical protein